MTTIVSFRLTSDDIQRLDERARAQGICRGTLVREIVTAVVAPVERINVKRLNETSEYSQAAMAALVDHLLPGQQNIIIATTAERLEVIHGQK